MRKDRVITSDNYRIYLGAYLNILITFNQRKTRMNDFKYRLKNIRQKIDDTMKENNVEEKTNNMIIYSKDYYNKIKKYYQMKKDQVVGKKKEFLEGVNYKIKRYREIKENQHLTKTLIKESIILLFCGINVAFLVMRYYYKKTQIRFTRFAMSSGVLFVGLNYYIQNKVNAHFNEKLKKEF